MKVAAIQITSGSDKAQNFAKVDRLAAEAAGKQAALLVLPEHWNWLGKNADKRVNAESLEGPSLRFMRELAKKHRFTVVAGSFGEKNGNKPPFNTSVVIHPDGSLGTVYRKIHLFDAQVAGGHKESEDTSGGADIVVENIGFGRVGLAICYDLRFPELFLQMAAKGANLFALPANFTAVTGVPHWEVLLRARAIENQCYVIAAGQTGQTGAGWEAHGHSMIVDPWGEILALAEKEETVITAEIDLEKLSDIRAKMPVHAHRRLV